MSETTTTTRTVTIYSTQGRGQSQTIETDAKTWGELRPKIEFNTSNVRAVVRENRTTLEANDAVLPEEEHTIFLYPTKVKSGAGTAIQDKYSGMTLAELKREVKKRKSMSTGSSNPVILRGKLRQHDKRNGNSSDCAPIVESKVADIPPTKDLYVFNSDDSLVKVVKNLQKGFNKTFDDTLRGIQDQGVSQVALEQDAEKIAEEIGANTQES